MGTKHLNEENRRLEQRLREESDYLRPAYSPQRHEAIMATVRREELVRQPRRQSSPPIPTWAGVLAGLALGIMLMVAVLSVANRGDQRSQALGTADRPGGNTEGQSPHGHGALATSDGFLRDHAGSQGAVTDPVAPIDHLARMPTRAAEEMTDSVVGRLSQGRWAYLDRDAHVATEFLRSKLPLGLTKSSGPDEVTWD